MDAKKSNHIDNKMILTDNKNYATDLRIQLKYVLKNDNISLKPFAADYLSLSYY